MIYFIYIIIVIAFLDTFSQLPIIGPFAQDLGATSIFIGLIIGVYSLTNLVGNLVAGIWIDKFGRKKILISGMLFVSVCLIGYTFVNTPQQLLVIRMLHGIGGGLLVPAAFAFLGDHAHTKNRGKTMALSGACVGVSAIIGPAFGAITTQVLGINSVFIIISILFLVTSLLIIFFLKESFLPKHTDKVKFEYNHFAKLLRLPPLINAYIGAFSLMLTLGILAYMLPFKMEETEQSAVFSGILLSTFGIVAILFFLLPTNQLFDRIRREKLILAGMLLVAVALVMLSSFNQLIILFTAMIFYGTGFACIFPSVTALVVDNSHKSERGKAFGLFYAFFSLGVVVGSFFIGTLNTDPNQGFFIGALIMSFLSFIIYRRIS